MPGCPDDHAVLTYLEMREHLAVCQGCALLIELAGVPHEGQATGVGPRPSMAAESFEALRRARTLLPNDAWRAACCRCGRTRFTPG